MSDRRKKGFYVTGTVRYKAPYDEKVHDGSLHFLSFSFFLSHYKQERKVKGCRNKHFVDLQQLQASLEKQWGVF